MSYKLNDRNNMKSLFMIASIVGITMFTACNSNEDIIETDHKVEVDGNQFTFKTEDFSTDESSTRTSNSIGTSSKTVDLGDGIQAEELTITLIENTNLATNTIIFAFSCTVKIFLLPLQRVSYIS